MDASKREQKTDFNFLPSQVVSLPRDKKIKHIIVMAEANAEYEKKLNAVNKRLLAAKEIENKDIQALKKEIEKFDNLLTLLPKIQNEAGSILKASREAKVEFIVRHFEVLQASGSLEKSLSKDSVGNLTDREIDAYMRQASDLRDYMEKVNIKLAIQKEKLREFAKQDPEVAAVKKIAEAKQFDLMKAIYFSKVECEYKSLTPYRMEMFNLLKPVMQRILEDKYHTETEFKAAFDGFFQPSGELAIPSAAELSGKALNSELGLKAIVEILRGPYHGNYKERCQALACDFMKWIDPDISFITWERQGIFISPCAQVIDSKPFMLFLWEQTKQLQRFDVIMEQRAGKEDAAVSALKSYVEKIERGYPALTDEQKVGLFKELSVQFKVMFGVELEKAEFDKIAEQIYLHANLQTKLKEKKLDGFASLISGNIQLIPGKSPKITKNIDELIKILESTKTNEKALRTALTNLFTREIYRETTSFADTSSAAALAGSINQVVADIVAAYKVRPSMTERKGTQTPSVSVPLPSAVRLQRSVSDASEPPSLAKSKSKRGSMAAVFNSLLNFGKRKNKASPSGVVGSPQSPDAHSAESPSPADSPLPQGSVPPLLRSNSTQTPSSDSESGHTESKSKRDSLIFHGRRGSSGLPTSPRFSDRPGNVVFHFRKADGDPLKDVSPRSQTSESDGALRLQRSASLGSAPTSETPLGSNVKVSIPPEDSETPTPLASPQIPQRVIIHKRSSVAGVQKPQSVSEPVDDVDKDKKDKGPSLGGPGGSHGS